MKIRRKGKTKSGEPIWSTDFFDTERIRHRPSFAGTKKMAEQRFVQVRRQINERIEKRNNQSLISLEEAVEMYLNSRNPDNITEGTIRRDKIILNHLMDVLSPNISIGEIDPEDISRYKRKRSKSKTRKGNHLSPAGLNTELRHMRAFFNWLVNERKLRESPMLGLKFLKVVSKPIRFLNSDELASISSILNEVDKMSRDLFNAYLFTGARKTEILRNKLKWSHVDFQRNILLLHTKGEKYRELPMQKELQAIMQTRKEEGESYPFNLSKDQAYTKIMNIYSLAGVLDANVHTIRKTTGVVLIQNGVDIFKVSKFLGHSSVMVTEKHYVDLESKNYRDMADILEMGMADIHRSARLVPKSSTKGGK